jgi:hypothetical protein
MMRRPLILAVSLIFLLLTSSVAAAQPAEWQEGVAFHYFYHHNIVQNSIVINAVKTTTPSGAEISALTIRFHCEPAQINTVFHDVPEVTIPLPGDPDNVEVSRDLGWGGLDTVLQVWDNETASIIPIEIHLSWEAIAPVTVVGGEYLRQSTVVGRIISPLCTFDFARQPYPTSYVFSTLRPRPYYG